MKPEEHLGELIKIKGTKMNIYLDIDGVILGTESPEKDIINLINYLLKHYKNNTYWLTTHCRNDYNHCAKWLKQNNFPSGLADKMDRIIQPTNWSVMKTEAIDMDQDFVWFDDSLLETERRTLEAYYVSDGFFKMNPKDPEMAKKALEFLKTKTKN